MNDKRETESEGVREKDEGGREIERDEKGREGDKREWSKREG